tara:strand:+ start:170 stop:487 length:318 start_codon:yes stop_codon:yes gene_type:complete
MTVTTAPTLKDPELGSFGFVESASVHSITDFIPEKTNESKVTTEKQKDDFINSFICHLLFYVVFCVSLVLHILIDLGFGSFLKNKFVQLIRLGKKNVLETSPAFA